MKRLLAAGIAVLACACSSDPSRFQSDWERKHEGELARQASERTPLVLPAYPRAADLLEFTVDGGSGFRFFVDRASISVGADRIVRYALVARSPSGVDNVSYEGLNCQAGEYRVYALGRPDASWLLRPGRWQPLSGSRMQPWHRELARSYFCPLESPILSAEEGAMALQRGGNPRAELDLTGGAPSGGK